MTAPSAIEYILVTNGLEGREEETGKGMCRMTRRRLVTKKKLEYASE